MWIYAKVTVNINGNKSNNAYFTSGYNYEKINLRWSTKEEGECKNYYKISFNIFDKNQVKNISYNDEHKMLFIDYKGVVKVSMCNWDGDYFGTHSIDECIEIVFKPNKYAKLQNYLERLGFQK